MLADKTRYLAWVGWIKERGAPECHGNSPRAALDPDRFLAIATGYESVTLYFSLDVARALRGGFVNVLFTKQTKTSSQISKGASTLRTFIER